MDIAKVLGSKGLTKVASGVAGTVYIMTGIKAVARPAFIYADKNSDAETKKYTAVKEFLYQILCLGITVAMLPFFKKGGKKLAENLLKKNNGIERTAELKENIIKGGEEAGYFVGSVLGLTIFAPLLSHEILHPVMKWIGLDKKQENSGQAFKPFLADAKVPVTESNNKIKLNA